MKAENIEDIYELSPMQQGMLFQELYTPEHRPYVVQFVFILRGDLNVQAMHDAWQRVVNHHPMLRTSFYWEKLGKTLQVVNRKVGLPLEQEDWCGLGGQEQERRLEDYLAEDRRRGFVLNEAPLMRLKLVTLEEGRHLLVWSHHHLLLDGWSLPLLFKEVFSNYEAELKGTSVKWPRVRPYRDYIEWLQKQSREAAESYWRETLRGFTAPTTLSIDSPAPSHEVGAGAARFNEQRVSLSAETTTLLQAFCRREQVTPSTLVQGAWALLLSRYSGQQDVLFGVTVSGRPADLAGVEEMVGLFINTLPLRVRVDEEEELGEWLRKVQGRGAEMRQYEATPLADVQRWSEVEGGRSLFESLVVFENYPVEAGLRAEVERRTGLQIEEARGVEQTNYRLSVVAVPGERLKFEISYDRQFITDDAIARLGGHVTKLLEEIATARAGQRLKELSLITDDERRQLLVDWNVSRGESTAQEVCIQELFERQVERAPEQVAVTFEHESLTYGELNARANQLAHYLQNVGVGPEVKVGICVERSLEMVVGLLGILKAGGAYVPLDPAYPAERLRYMLEDAGISVLLTQESLRKTSPLSAAHVVRLDADAERIAAQSKERPQSTVNAQNLAYMIYTSGSTGRPKGALITHEALVNYTYAINERFELSHEDRFLQFASLSFDVAVEEIFPTLLSGATLVIPRETPAGSDFTEFVERERLTAFELPTAFWQEWMYDLSLSRTRMPDCVRLVVVGGEKNLPDRFAMWQQRAGLKAGLLHVYGLTETTITSTTYRVAPGTNGRERHAVLPIGRPLSNTEVYVLDKHLRPVPVGVMGGLYIGGDSLGRGYHNRFELTAERFIPHPFSNTPGARLYSTGDHASYLADGNIEFIGRIDEQVKVRGFRIELGEIEAALAAHADVREAVVIASDDEETGHKRLIAYVVADTSARPSNSPDIGELREYLGERLPEYMVPSLFVTLEELPLTPNGKVDRKALPAPDESRPDTAGEYVAPSTPVEQALADIWCKVLGLEQVGIHDNFFDLGGDSILSIQIVSRAAQAGLKLTPKHLFQHQSIAELAQVATSTVTPQAAPQSAPEEAIGDAPLTPIQKWFFEQQLPRPHHWNQALLLETDSQLDPALLSKAVAALVGHHDALRTRFASTADGWRQVVEAPTCDAQDALTVIDLSTAEESQRRGMLEAAAGEAQASLNLQAGPLLRVLLFRMGQGEPARLLIVIHHLVVDGVSWRVLLEDLQTAYAQLASGGGRVSLPAKTTSFRRWAQRLAEYADSEAVRGEASYWLDAVNQEVSALPVDYADGGNTEAEAETLTLSLSADETDALLREVPSAYRTEINDALLTSLAHALSRWCGASRVRVELEGHGREEIDESLDVTRTVGWFTTLYPVLLEVGAEGGPGADLKRVKEQLRGVPSRGIGYGLLRYLGDDCEVRERLRDAGQADVVFNYLGQLDSAVSGDSMWRAAGEGSGSAQDGEGERGHKVAVNAMVRGGVLEVSWGYSRGLHERETIERVAGWQMEALRELIAHCRSEEAGGYTVSDFPLARLGESELERVTAGRGRQVEDIYALSPMQQGMLFHNLYAPEAGHYIAQLVLTFQGELNVPALKRAWQEVVNRYPELRVSFAWKELSEPVQLVHKTVNVPWDEQDWRGLSSDERQTRLETFLQVDRRRGFDLSSSPLLRLTLIRVSESAYQLVWSLGMVLLDGWSLPLLFKEVFAHYEAERQGTPVKAARSRPYRDYIAWLQRQPSEAAENYWRETLRGFNAPTTLAVETPSSQTEAVAEHYTEQHISLDAETTNALQSFCRQHQLTLNTLVQGAWALLLSRYSGQDDVVFGVTVSGRPADLAGVEEMVGLFINTLPMRVQVDEGQEVGEWLRKVQERGAEMRQYEATPLAEVQRWSEVEGGRSLFESLVVFENYPMDARLRAEVERRTGLNVEDIHTVEQTNYGLALVAFPGEELMLKLIYDDAKFDGEMIERLRRHLGKLLEGIAAARPEQRLKELALLADDEREQLLYGWNQNRQDYPQDVCINEVLEQVAGRAPAQVALVHEGESLTYGELDARANQLAHYLQNVGVGPEVKVGVCVERSHEMVVAFLGILKAGGAYVPLDPAYPTERLSFMLEDAGISVLLTQESLAEKFVEDGLRLVRLDGERQAIARESKAGPQSLSTPDNLAYVIYTSGSTGRPKGVEITHRSLMNLTTWLRTAYEVTASDRMTQVSSIGFDASVWELWPFLACGATVFVAGDETRMSPELLRDWLVSNEITLSFAPTPVAERLLALEWPEEVALRALLTGGDKLHSYPAPTLPFSLFNNYGPTEVTAISTFGLVPATQTNRHSPTIGRAVSNTQLYVLDGDLQPVPVGVVGELYLGGDSVGRGYLNRPALTAEKFIPDPFGSQPGARLYRTGDLVRYMPSGEIDFLGRTDHQVKIRGFRIELGEIESALMTHEDVAEAVVVATADERGGNRLVAYVVGSRPSELNVVRLRRHLEERLPAYMVPSAFVKLDELPLTPNGKVDRKALPAPSVSHAGHLDDFVAPRTAVEQALADIWCKVLGLERVGAHDNFFDLGGHSLLATQVVSRINQLFSIDLPLRLLFESPTVGSLAARVSLALSSAADVAPPPPLSRRREEGEPAPLSFAQQRLWFLHQLEPESAAYNVPMALRLTGALDVQALGRTLDEVVRRHEVLRTSFGLADGSPVQIVHEPRTLPLPVEDLSSLPEDERLSTAQRLAGQEARLPFDLSSAPLLRTRLLRLAEEDHVLLFTLHHIVSDGWSTGVLVKEVAALYEAFRRGEESPLPELPVQYADFALWQRQWLQGEALERQLGYWKGQLGGTLPVLELPTDRPRPAVRSYAGANCEVRLGTELTDKLKELGRRHGATLYMVLLGAFQTLLRRYTGQEDIAVGSPIANRTRAEVEGLIGFFVNTLVMRTDLSEDPSFAELLGRVREVTLGAYAHQDVPFEKLVEELQPERSLSHTPLFQTMLVLQNTPRGALELEGLRLEEFGGAGSGTAKFDLTLTLAEGAEGLEGVLEYNSELFDGGTVERMVSHLQRLLEAAVTNPQQRLSELPLLTESEERQFVVEWNDTAHDLPKGVCLHQLFEQQVRRIPDAVAVVYEGEQLSYRELNNRANQLARYLRNLGIGPEDRVSFLLERSPAMVVALLGILKAGAAYVPLDATYPRERLSFMVEDSGTKLLIAERGLRDLLPASLSVPVFCMSEAAQLLDCYSTANLQTDVTAENLAYIIYTSGSTGTPKGVMIQHHGVVNYLLHCLRDYDISRGEGVPVQSPVSFDLTVSSLHFGLVAGQKVRLLPEAEGADALVRALRGQGPASFVKLTPAHLDMLSQTVRPEEAAECALAFMVGGEALTWEQLAFWQKHAPQTRIINEYGPTETVVGCSIYEVKNDDAESPEARAGGVPIGKPVANAQLYVLDEHLRLVPPGVRGELYVGGDGVGRGYVNRPEQTAQRFIPDPFSAEPGARLYRTGDICRQRAEGTLEYVGRIDSQVKVRGYRIELSEIEAALMQHEAVGEAVIVAEDEGRGHKRLVAYLTAEKDAQAEALEAGELRRYLREKLPEYMVPAAFMLLNAMPLTTNGKVDRKALPASDGLRTEPCAVYVAPRNQTEEVLAKIWEEVLRVERVGVEDNFFDLGGHSLLATRLLSQVREVFGVEVALREVFAEPTVAALATAIEELLIAELEELSEMEAQSQL